MESGISCTGTANDDQKWIKMRVPNDVFEIIKKLRDAGLAIEVLIGDALRKLSAINLDDIVVAKLKDEFVDCILKEIDKARAEIKEGLKAKYKAPQVLIKIS